jgi:hypothetical protein
MLRDFFCHIYTYYNLNELIITIKINDDKIPKLLTEHIHL